MNLKDFTIQSIGSHPLIDKFRKFFYENDKSVFLSPQFLTKTTAEKWKHLHSNFIKIFQALEAEDQSQVAEVLPYLEYIAPVGSHYINLNAFYQPIKILSSDEQISKWGNLFLGGRCVGAFAQTEISHGSDVQSLQTTATYDIEKKCFVLNTPNIGSIKIWSGLSGITATHIICQAQVYIKGKRYGLQGFVVPIRDPKTYKLFPGVEAWDIGVKLGSNLIDDGSIKFTNYEIPRDCLMMKFLKVEEDGTVKALGGKEAIKIGYGGMLALRTRLMKGLLRDSYRTLMVWYESCLKQGNMDYLQKTKILSEFSYVYAGIAAIEQVSEIYNVFVHNIRTNVKAALGGLEELHLVVSGLKTLYSWGVIDQTRRFTMEGQIGDLNGAGLVDTYADRVPAATYEGDSAVMLQQVARGLCKYMHYVENDESAKIPSLFKWIGEAKGRLDESGEIVNIRIDKVEGLMELDKIEEVIDMIGLINVKENSDRMKGRIMGGGKLKKVWNEEVQKGMVDMGLSVTKGITFKMAKRNLVGGNKMENVKKEDVDILKDLLRVYGLDLILKSMQIACRFKVEGDLGNFEDVVIEARKVVMERLVGSLRYIGESSPFSKEDLLYVRDYRELSKGSGFEEKSQVEEIKQCINTFSKL